MLTEFGLQSTALERLATIVRGADTARPELAPQAPGLLAISLGLSQLIDDDLNQLEEGSPMYDALYLWCRDASEETHNWPSKSVGGHVDRFEIVEPATRETLGEVSFREALAVWARIGVLSFGGPTAQIALDAPDHCRRKKVAR